MFLLYWKEVSAKADGGFCNFRKISHPKGYLPLSNKEGT